MKIQMTKLLFKNFTSLKLSLVRYYKKSAKFNLNLTTELEEIIVGLMLGDLFAELATLCFFTVTGYKFRPASDNPYFALELEDAGQPVKTDSEF